MNRVDIEAILEEIGIGVTDTALRHWTDILGGLPLDIVSEAIHIHQRTNAFMPTAREIADIVVGIQARNAPQPPPKRRAVLAAYQINAALADPCPNCHADAGQACTAASGLEARCPCVARLVRKRAAA
ncbi:hypothetical protein [Nocardia thailandica]|uniref:hypothetical protein n=1 Tax=Nocardia thailandica TaxID=257275 RepID=UPI0002DA6DC1|nr:hypothetical protein [Nocardia thailandica]